MLSTTDTNTFHISRKFTTRVQRSERVLEVAESFGLGLEDSDFVIFDNLPVTINQGDVIFITGQSGSGKSLLLRELSSKLKEAGKTIADLESLSLPEIPVVEIVGKNTHEAYNLLSQAGISDVWIFIRKPSELSDGQRYRLKLAMLLDSDADVWVADEFCAVLDRVTAQAVAFNIQKMARKKNKTLIVATTHDDLKDALGANLFVRKAFRERVSVDVS